MNAQPCANLIRPYFPILLDVLCCQFLILHENTHNSNIYRIPQIGQLAANFLTCGTREMKGEKVPALWLKFIRTFMMEKICAFFPLFHSLFVHQTSRFLPSITFYLNLEPTLWLAKFGALFEQFFACKFPHSLCHPFLPKIAYFENALVFTPSVVDYKG